MQGAQHCEKIRLLPKHLDLAMFHDFQMLIRLAAACLVADVWNETVATHPGVQTWTWLSALGCVSLCEMLRSSCRLLFTHPSC